MKEPDSISPDPLWRLVFAAALMVSSTVGLVAYIGQGKAVLAGAFGFSLGFQAAVFCLRLSDRRRR